MTTKYKTGWGISITEIEIARETEHSVWPVGNECRSKKYSTYEQFHATYDDAFNFLHSKYESKVNSARSDLQNAENNYATMLTLKRQTQELLK